MLADRPRTRPAGLADRAKASLVVRMRRTHQRTIEHSSTRTFRKRVVPTSPPPRLVPAASVHADMGWLPAALLAPETLPPEAKLPMRYVLPYYGTSKLGWLLYGKLPIDPSLAWNDELPWNDAFPAGRDEWGHPTDDATFTALRLQGPNPFELRRASADPAMGDGPDDVVFDLDLGPFFDGVFPATCARFRVEGDGLVPAWIRIGDEQHRPGDPGWGRAKSIVNALDARYVTFIRHLFNTHLMVGQAFAVAAHTLPVWHPLREFMDFFTYGTLQVNHFAYQALLTPNSYFLRSNFVRPADARRIVENSMAAFDFDEWSVPLDIAKRGLDAIPGHPYVEDARTVWPMVERVVDRHLDDLHVRTDADVVDDPHLAAWYGVVRQVLPGVESVPRLDGVASLRRLCTALVYNNVIHEICGNLSPILDSEDHADKAGLSFETLRELLDHDVTPTPAAADVFLMEQASFVSRFNVAGNNLQTINAARHVDDPRLRRAIEDLQSEMIEAGRVIAERNATRAIPFRGMEPHRWETSISY